MYVGVLCFTLALFLVIQLTKRFQRREKHSDRLFVRQRTHHLQEYMPTVVNLPMSLLAFTAKIIAIVGATCAAVANLAHRLHMADIATDHVIVLLRLLRGKSPCKRRFHNFGCPLAELCWVSP